MHAGCSPQACAYRDHFAQLTALGVSAVYGVSTQDTDYQAEAQQRLHLPFPLLSDSSLRLTQALRLPTMKVKCWAPAWITMPYSSDPSHPGSICFSDIDMYFLFQPGCG